MSEEKTRRIRYGFKIDQAALWIAGVRGVDYADLAIYEFICGMMRQPKSDKLYIGNQVFVYASTNAIIEQMPYLSRRGKYSKDAVFDRITNLVNQGLLIRHPDNRSLGMAYYSPSEMATEATEVYISNDDFDPDTLGEFSQGLGKSSQGGMANSPKGVRQIRHTITNKNITTKNELKEKETRAQEIEKPGAMEESKAIEVPVHKIEQQPPKQISTLDIKKCEGHDFSIGVAEYPMQSAGRPFCHPNLCLERIPFDKRIDAWWALYGVNQGKGKCEMLLMQNDMADDEQFAKLYRHTFLYVVAQSKDYRAKPEKYLRDRMWLDDIIDRRLEKEKPEAKSDVPASEQMSPDDPRWGYRNSPEPD